LEGGATQRKGGVLYVLQWLGEMAYGRYAPGHLANRLMGVEAHQGHGEDLASPLSLVFSSSASFSSCMVAFSPWAIGRWGMPGVALPLPLPFLCYSGVDAVPGWFSWGAAKCGDDLAGRKYSPGHPFLF